MTEAEILADFPDLTSEDIRACLAFAADRAVWEYAAKAEYTIVTKDADFRQHSFLYGHPPKVIWVRLGNCSTCGIAELLRARRHEIELFHAAGEQAFLRLG